MIATPTRSGGWCAQCGRHDPEAAGSGELLPTGVEPLTEAGLGLLTTVVWIEEPGLQVFQAILGILLPRDTTGSSLQLQSPGHGGPPPFRASG